MLPFCESCRCKRRSTKHSTGKRQDNSANSVSPNVFTASWRPRRSRRRPRPPWTPRPWNRTEKTRPRENWSWWRAGEIRLSTDHSSLFEGNKKPYSFDQARFLTYFHSTHLLSIHSAVASAKKSPSSQPEETAPITNSPLSNVCGDCGRVFNSSEGLKKHSAISHVTASPLVSLFCWNVRSTVSKLGCHSSTDVNFSLDRGVRLIPVRGLQLEIRWRPIRREALRRRPYCRPAQKTRRLRPLPPSLPQLLSGIYYIILGYFISAAFFAHAGEDICYLSW